MTNFTDFMEQALLGHTLLGSTLTAPTPYLSLATTIATDCATFTEVVSGLGYDRVQISWGAPTSGPAWSVLNDVAVNFAQATTPWGSVAHYVITDSATIGQGNPLYWVDLGTPRAVDGGDVLQVGVGKIIVRLD